MRLMIVMIMMDKGHTEKITFLPFLSPGMLSTKYILRYYQSIVRSKYLLCAEDKESLTIVSIEKQLSKCNFE